MRSNGKGFGRWHSGDSKGARINYLAFMPSTYNYAQYYLETDLLNLCVAISKCHQFLMSFNVCICSKLAICCHHLCVCTSLGDSLCLWIPGGMHTVDGEPLAHPQLEHDAVPW